MFRPVRTAGLAAGVCAFIALCAWGAPLAALQSDAPPPATSWLDHETASVSVSAGALGLNDPAAEPAVATVAPPPPLDEMVETYAGTRPDDAEQSCLASAVYFEARGEPLEGQLAVAEVVLNRTRSGRYPRSVCAVVRQPAQFSFVRHGRIPRADRGCEAWRRAVAIARIAEAGDAPRAVDEDVLWYHADYVDPAWGRRLDRAARIGLHIFYS